MGEEGIYRFVSEHQLVADTLNVLEGQQVSGMRPTGMSNVCIIGDDKVLTGIVSCNVFCILPNEDDDRLLFRGPLGMGVELFYDGGRT